MNILFINSSRDWGGGERWLMDISKGLQERGHRITIVCHQRSALEQRISSTIADTVPLQLTGDFNPATIFAIRRLLKARAIDLVCTNFEKDLRIGGLAALGTGIPVVPSREVDVPLKNTFLNKFFYTRIASAILVNSYSTLNTLLVNSPWLQRQRMEVVWKGVAPESQQIVDASALRASLVNSATDCLIGFVGRLDEQKGIPTLLEAMRLVITQRQGITLAMAGEGNLLEHIREYSRKHHLEKNIVTAGFQHNVGMFYDAVDFIVMPSYWEGFGYSALEAMLHNKAIVGTHTSSLPEIIKEGTTGVLIPPRSAEQLAEAILVLSNDAILRKKMGIAGAERAKRLFPISSMIEKTELFFLSAMHSGQTK